MISHLLIILLATSTILCITTPAITIPTSSRTVTPIPTTSTSAPFVGNVCGGVSSLNRWARTGRSDTIQMNIDTSSCRFENTPLYFTSITGLAGHYLLVGVNAIYEPTQSCFVINVRSLTNETADTLMAWSAQYQWNVNWFGYSP